MQPEVYREMAELQDRHWWFVARRRILAGVIERLALPPQADILEIGCGTGGNLAGLSRFGRLRAMEQDDVARVLAEELGVCAVVSGGLPEPVPFEDAGFDLVCLLDVLEHVEDDAAALCRAARLIKPGGRLLVTVPAYAWLWSGHDEAHHHHRRYTTQTLRCTAQRAGVQISRIGYFNSLLFPAIAAARLAIKLSGDGREGSDAALPNPMLNALLTGVFGLERYVVPSALFPFGTSVMAVLTACP